MTILKFHDKFDGDADDDNEKNLHKKRSVRCNALAGRISLLFLFILFV